MSRIGLSNKEWKDYTASEKRTVVHTFGPVLALIIISVSSGFLNALVAVFGFYSLFWLAKAAVSKKNRPVYIVMALLFLIPTGISASALDDQVSNVGSQESRQETNDKTATSVEEVSDSDEALDEAVTTGGVQSNSDEPIYTEGELYKVTGIVDGDTIKVNIGGKVETIRFIGMDTPETKDPRKPVQCFGKEASSRMQHYAQSKYVRLEADPSQGDRDRYDRLLRYVYTEDGKNIAYHMIKEGYAHEYTYDSVYRYQSQFKDAYRYAQDNSLGLWSPSTCGGNTNQQAAVSSNPKSSPPQPQSSSAPVVGDVYYKNCAAARAAGAAPVYEGQPGYGRHLDRDNDGIGCE